MSVSIYEPISAREAPLSDILIKELATSDSRTMKPHCFIPEGCAGVSHDSHVRSVFFSPILDTPVASSDTAACIAGHAQLTMRMGAALTRARIHQHSWWV